MFSWPDGGSAGWSPPSAKRWQGSQSSEGATELVFPGPALWKMQSEASRPAREKNRRRRVLVVTSCWPRPMRVVQRASNCVGCQERWAISAGHEPRHVELFLGAERVSRPAREKNRRRRVLVVTSCWPRPMRVVQRARLWAITCTASQAALAAKRPEGRWFSPTPYLRSRMAFSISAWRRWSASSSRVSPSRSVMKP